MNKYTHQAGCSASLRAVLAVCLLSAASIASPAFAAERLVLVEEFTNTF